MTLIIRIDGFEFGDWIRFEASRSVRDATAQFTLEVTEAASVPAAFSNRALRSGVNAELVLSDLVAITGKIDEVARSFDAETHQVTARGRGSMAGAIDSSVILPDGGQLRGRTLDQVISTILSPFGLALDFVGDPGPAFPSVVALPGESAWELVERLSRQRGRWVHEAADGRVVCDRGISDRPKARIVEGLHIKAGSSIDRSQARHSEIVVKAQRPGRDGVSGTETSEIEARVPDVNVGAYRPLVIVAEEPLDRAGARLRADWEATVRAAESVEMDVTLQGWLRDDGLLWDAGDRVDATSPTLAIDREMVVRDVRWSLDDQNGELVALSLVPPEALDATRPAAAASDSGGTTTGASGTAAKRGRAVPGIAPDGFEPDRIWTESKPQELAK